MKIVKSSIHFNRVILHLIFSQSFITITLIGNAIILGFSWLFYYCENGVNTNLNTYLDAVWWGFATATTVGYGDIIPVTSTGKVIGIVLMLIGTSLFATFTALFAKNILEDELFLFSDKIDKNSASEDFLSDLKSHKKLIEKQIKNIEKNKYNLNQD